MDAAPAPAPADAKRSDVVRTYVWVMAVFALVFGVAYWRFASIRDSYREANEEAPRVFGTERPAGAQVSPDARPTTISSLAVGILKYLQTYKEAKVKPEEGGGRIPIQLVRDRASGVGMNIKTTPQEQTNPVRSKGYDEVYASFGFEPTDLERLATFLYNFEVSTTKYRVLELRWDLRTEKENPIVPGVSFGNAIQGPQVKIGYRRPIAGTVR